MSIKVLSASVDSNNGVLVVRGVIDPGHLKNLAIPAYQREIQPVTTIQKIRRGFATGTVPDVFLSMRGDKIRRGQEEGVIHLLDGVYIVDGLQRVSAALQMVGDPTAAVTPRVGAEIHIGRDEPWEREMFRILNLERTRLSANVIIRNAAEDCPSAKILLKLSEDPNFPLKGRVCFSQNMRREQLITATTLVKIAGSLHSRFGFSKGSDVLAVINGLDRIVDGDGKNQGIGEKAFRVNVNQFFQIIRDLWGLSQISVREASPQIKYGFLRMLSIFICRMDQFWEKGPTFTIDRETMRKMGQFSLKDSGIRDLCSSTGQAERILYAMFLEHMNKGRRTNRFVDPKLLAALGAKGRTPADDVEEEDADMAVA